PSSAAPRGVQPRDPGLERALATPPRARCAPAPGRGGRAPLDLPTTTRTRPACTMLSAEVSRRQGEAGLSPGTISLKFTGSAGQSLCAWLPPRIGGGVGGGANHYLGEGLSARPVLGLPPPGAPLPPPGTTISST